MARVIALPSRPMVKVAGLSSAWAVPAVVIVAAPAGAAKAMQASAAKMVFLSTS
jgi:hypothetical protein